MDSCSTPHQNFPWINFIQNLPALSWRYSVRMSTKGKISSILTPFVSLSCYFKIKDLGIRLYCFPWLILYLTMGNIPSQLPKAFLVVDWDSNCLWILSGSGIVIFHLLEHYMAPAPHPGTMTHKHQILHFLSPCCFSSEPCKMVLVAFFPA